MRGLTAATVLMMIGLVSINILTMQTPSPWPGVVAVGSMIAILAVAIFAFGRLSYRLDVERSLAQIAQEDLARLAQVDGLTLLANRGRFNIEIEDAVGEAVAGRKRFALVLFDLNRFKGINDTFGHAGGDAVLVSAASRIRQVFGDSCPAARLGGDEFAIILDLSHYGDDFDDALARLNASLNLPVMFEGMEISTGASVGVAICPDHADTSARLQTLADRALYRAKSLGGGVCQIDGVMLEASRAEDELANDIAGAFKRREFVFYYQTKVRLSDGAHVGFEALARWQHPRLGLVYPDTFIPLLERMGLMVELTRHLLDQVADDIAGWRAAGLTPGPVAVNLPEAILGTSLALRQIEDALLRHDLPWSAITAELTEDVFIDRALSHIQANVLEMSRRGMRIALDDFGTGYASLTHLKTFPFDEIKIDRSFIMDLGKDPNSERIAAALISLCRDLGKVVVAEGIETPEQRGWLREHGCALGQGFLFGYPEPAEEAANRLASVGGLISAARRMQMALVPKDDTSRRTG
jgi:diguanylate cyclase (GGDEF)-like protein